MKARIEIVYVTQNAPKKNYLFYANNKLYKIADIKDNNIYGEDVFDEKNPITVFNVEHIKDTFVKFLANTDKLIFSIIRRDYSDIVGMLQTYFVSNNIDTHEAIGKMIANNASCNVEGKIIKISSKPKKDSIVEICNINIIDNNNLYDKTSRLFTIKDFEYKKSTIMYTLTRDNITIKCNRESFKTINMANHKNLFTLKI